MKEYDRMNPDIDELINRLEEYSEMTNGAEAYPLSVAEASKLIRTINRLLQDIGIAEYKREMYRAGYGDT